ncbi:formylglycine-generating enzyme family protein [Prauserella cavernicola]|uniref:Formylglycine-generating enzyme family protein n=1 Tax=Prauserella cavernicola TaxID=2800127 RepID=A0A934V4A2_9PSEU|nr:formylglycine-generating enzyme family protein [Prauserella cavernicola]MBK1783373.1 formylglycine-generating enzyme family protein [Prauserella cavernicola]
MNANAGTTLLEVPPGRVTLADRRTQRAWDVEVAAFRLSPFPVTQACYAAVTGLSPSTARGGLRPVEGVSWPDAVRFCNALSEREGLTLAYRIGADVEWDRTADGYRLPTEAEWEYACRAGTTGARYGPLDEIAWYRGNSGERSHDVGGKRANDWGLHDLLGNVWEWCWDAFAAADHPGYRVLRGGGWSDEHWSCRASVRRRSHPDFRIDDVGFRIARTMPSG